MAPDPNHHKNGQSAHHENQGTGNLLNSSQAKKLYGAAPLPIVALALLHLFLELALLWLGFGLLGLLHLPRKSLKSSIDEVSSRIDSDNRHQDKYDEIEGAFEDGLPGQLSERVVRLGFFEFLDVRQSPGVQLGRRVRSY